MSLLLASETTEIGIIIGIILFAIFIAVLIIVGLRKFFGRQSQLVSRNEPKNFNLKLNKEYLTPKELNFLNALTKALPPDFVAFPKVAITSIVEPASDKLVRALIAGKVLDVCIFTRSSMEPIMAIDLIESEVTSLSFHAMHPVLLKALASVKIPVLEIDIKPSYEISELKRSIVNIMPDRIVAMIRKDLMSDK